MTRREELIEIIRRIPNIIEWRRGVVEISSAGLAKIEESYIIDWPPNSKLCDMWPSPLEALAAARELVEMEDSND